MKRIITIYTEHRNSTQFYLRNTLEKFHPVSFDAQNMKRFFEFEKAAEVIYAVSPSFVQSTPSFGRKEDDERRQGADKSFYFKWVSFAEESIHVSNPYLHHMSGRPTLTVVKQEGDFYLVADFDMLILLEELRLIEYNSIIDKANKIIMGSGGLLLGIVSVFLILYGAYIFGGILFMHHNQNEVMHKIFTSIISITIGLAIYDLAKTMIENEVLFKSLDYGVEMQSKTLGKFLTSIIIALSIESLMAVFKIVLDDYSKIINAFYLIIGVTLLIVGTGVYNYLSRQSK
jgi:multisubunit Na+/H+ antiporter MnhC subunit